MAWDIRTWNLGFVGLIAGCTGALVPTEHGESGSESSGGSSPTEASIGDDSPPPPECEQDSDCGPGFQCRYGSCEYEYYCSTCCGDDCGYTDSGPYYECSDDADCREGGICIENECVSSEPLDECGGAPLVVESLPIPTGDFATNLAFVDGPADAPDRLVIVGDSHVGRVASDGSVMWSDAPTTSQSPRRVLVADFDGDGDEDVALTGDSDGVAGIATFAIGDGAPELIAFSPGDGQTPDVGDFDGDGNMDIVQYDSDQGDVISAGLGAGTFAPPVPTGFAVTWLFVADLDGDGRHEVVAENGTALGFSPLFQIQPFVELQTAEPELYIGSVVAGDVDGDGTRDILTMRGWPATVIERNDATGTLFATQLVTTASAPGQLADLAGDGMQSLVLHAGIVRNPAADSCLLTYAEPGGVRQIATGDWDGDGRDDVVIQREQTYDFAIVQLASP